MKNQIILLFDEAAYSLDTIKKVEMEKSLNILSNKMTLISIAHRFNAIQNSNMLKMKKSKYQNLVKLQNVYNSLYKYS